MHLIRAHGIIVARKSRHLKGERVVKAGDWSQHRTSENVVKTLPASAKLMRANGSWLSATIVT
jgi:hypothetical protein